MCINQYKKKKKKTYCKFTFIVTKELLHQHFEWASIRLAIARTFNMNI